jgi:4-amino-4-deoxy-L-arabinose transferase-like glycosyltransferase
LKLYWSSAESPLNPGGYDQFSNFVYGTLPLFTTRAAARWVDSGCGDAPEVLPSLYRALLLGTTDLCTSGYYTGYSGIHLVGRSLSGLADLVTLLGLVLLAKTLYGGRTALLSGMLYALAPLPIQHAHFFVVDSFATVFVVWALLFCVLSAKLKRPAWLIPAGLATGLAVASKASVWPLAAIVAVAGLYRPAQEGGEEVGRQRPRAQFTIPVVAALALAGAAAALAFRTTQPYAFTGPGFWNVGLNSKWLITMKEISELMRGLRDVPFGHQWTARTPIIFPWSNMVVWGLGLPIGLAAWAGWSWMGLQLMHRRRIEHLLPWLWGTMFFLYQAGQWVKSMRYLLPVYPVFVLFAAWMAVRVATGAQRSEQSDDGESYVQLPSGETSVALSAIRRAIVQPLARALPILLVAGAAVWCLVFLSLDRNPLTRIEASRWMYDNVPTAVVLQTESGETLNVPWSPRLALTPDQNVSTVTFIAPRSARVTGISLPKVSGSGVNGVRMLRAAVGGGIASSPVDIPGLDSVALSMRFDTPVDLEEGEIIVLELALVDGPAPAAYGGEGRVLQLVPGARFQLKWADQQL